MNEVKQEHIEYGNRVLSRSLLPWNQEFLDDFTSRKHGILAIHPYQKKIYWYSSVIEACQFNNAKNEIMGDFDDPRHFITPYLACHSGNGECARDGGRVYQGFIWCHTDIFSNKLIAKNLKYFPRPMKNSNGITFENIDEAAEWVKAKGLSTASDGIIKRSLRKNLEGKTKKSYGLEWTKI